MKRSLLFILIFLTFIGMLGLYVGAGEAKALCQCISSFMCPPGGPQGPLDCFWCDETGLNCDSCECCYGCGGGTSCFTGDTPIRMADDTEKPIAEVEVGEMVKSFDPETGEITESEVTEVYEHPKEQIEGYYLLTTESGREIKVTPEHTLLVLNENGERVWKTAEEITIGDYAFVYDESGDIIQKTDDTEEAQALIDQQQSQPQSSKPNLLQTLLSSLTNLLKSFVGI